jgi:hypothetical protein
MEVEEKLRKVEKYIEEQYEKDMWSNEAKYENALELFEIIEKKPFLWDKEAFKLNCKV